MSKRFLVLSWSLLFASPLWAITCYYTLAKESCWLKYDVTVDVIDVASEKILTTVTVPAGKLWTRVTFPCETNGQSLKYAARFSPLFWENDKGKVFFAKRSWTLPNKVNPGDSAWNVSVCYPNDFSQVPMPPDANSNCACDFASIPAIPPKQL